MSVDPCEHFCAERDEAAYMLYSYIHIFSNLNHILEHILFIYWQLEMARILYLQGF